MLTVPRDVLKQYIDRELEPSAWLTIDQDRINAFAVRHWTTSSYTSTQRKRAIRRSVRPSRTAT
jgi:hypothetical protein